MYLWLWSNNFFKFGSRKGTKRYIKNMLLILFRNFSSLANELFWVQFGPRNDAFRFLLIFSNIFFKLHYIVIVRDKKGGAVMIPNWYPPCLFYYWFLISKFCWINSKALGDLCCVYHHLCLLKSFFQKQCITYFYFLYILRMVVIV